MRRVIVGAIAVAAVAVQLSGGVAHAGTESVESHPACTRDDVDRSESNPNERTDHLPMHRWSDAAGSVHTRLGAKAWDDIDAKLNRKWIAAPLMGMGHSIFNTAGSIVEFAERFDVLCSAVGDADQVFAVLGDAVFSSGLVTIVIAAGVVVLIARAARRGEQPWGRATRLMLTMIALGVMLNGARLSTPSTDTAAGTVGRGSPGWIALELNNAISRLANTPAAALAQRGSLSDFAETQTAELGGDVMSCAQYRQELRDAYVGTYDDPAAASVPLVLSAMWETSGLTSWRIFQYGDTDLGARVDCRYLETAAGVPWWEQQHYQQRAQESESVPVQGMAALYNPDSNKDIDRIGIAWAACFWNGSTWEWTAEFAPVLVNRTSGFGSDDPGETCQDIFVDDDNNITGGAEDFELTDSESSIEAATLNEGASEARTFLLNWHGDVYGSSLVIAGSYFVTSILIFVCFGLLGIGLIITKVVLVAMIPLLILALVASLWPGRSDDAKVARFFKMFAGATVYSFLLTFILGLVTVIAGYIAKAGSVGPVMSRGSPIGIMWVGFSPVFAVFIVHLLFRSAGMPSPFKPSAAIGYGAALAGTGAAVGIGIDRLVGRGNLAGRRGLHRTRELARNTPTGKSRRADPHGRGAPRGRFADGADLPAERTGAMPGSDPAAAGRRSGHRSGLGPDVRHALGEAFPRSTAVAHTASRGVQHARTAGDTVRKPITKAADRYTRNPRAGRLLKAGGAAAVVAATGLGVPALIGGYLVGKVAAGGLRTGSERWLNRVDTRDRYREYRNSLGHDSSTPHAARPSPPRRHLPPPPAGTRPSKLPEPPEPPPNPPGDDVDRPPPPTPVTPGAPPAVDEDREHRMDEQWERRGEGF